jgi:hypothetical protein
MSGREAVNIIIVIISIRMNRIDSTDGWNLITYPCSVSEISREGEDEKEKREAYVMIIRN